MSASMPQISTLAQLRADIAVTHDFAYFQTGSEGPVPDSTQRVMEEAIRIENRQALGGRNAYGDYALQAEEARRTLATLLGAAPEEVAWTQNTSTSNRLAAGSLPWQKGGRLALSDTEHVSTRMMQRRIEQMTGQRATVIPSGNGSGFSPARFLEELDRRLTADHRLLIMSHASCLDGRRLPIAEATRIAHARGVKVLIDGAQAVGQFPVDVAAIDPDFYAGSIHKWLLGPAGIGYLYVARRQLPEYYPNLAPYPEPGAERGERPLTASGQTQTGTETMSMRIGAGQIIGAFLRIGIETIEAHGAALTRRLRDGLRQMAGFEMLSPYEWALSSGITSLRFAGRSEQDVHALIDRIWDEYRVVVKFQTDFAGIRISVASFNSVEEVDRLLAALQRLIPAM